MRRKNLAMQIFSIALVAIGGIIGAVSSDKQIRDIVKEETENKEEES